MRGPGSAKRSRRPAVVTLSSSPSSIGSRAPVKPDLGSSLHDPSDPGGWLLSDVPAMVDRDRPKATLGRLHGVCARER